MGEHLVPVAASVDASRVPDWHDITPSAPIPMRASAFTIREGRSWTISNTFEFQFETLAA